LLGFYGFMICFLEILFRESKNRFVRQIIGQV
jgi:hypothetical protein